MKKHKLFKKTTVYLFSIGMSILLLAGCQSKNTQSSNAQNTNRPSQEQMKKRMQDNIQPLVTAGTITQEQADKIIAAYTTRPAGNKQNRSQDKQQNNNQRNNQNRQKNNPLSKLVSDGVITQAQADAVMEKMKSNFTHRNNDQNSQDNNSQSSN